MANMITYHPLPTERIKNRRKILQENVNVIKRLWTQEIQVYEQSGWMKNDSRMFPYHIALYPLLDMYYDVSYVYSPALDAYEVKIVPYEDMDIIRENRRLPGFFPQTRQVRIPSYFPCSANSIYQCMVPPYRHEQLSQHDEDDESTISSHHHSTTTTTHDSPFIQHVVDYSFIQHWRSSIRKEMYVSLDISIDSTNHEQKTHSDHVIDKDNTTTKFTSQFGLSSIHYKSHKIQILFKLLKHATSDLQRDHRLATAILLAIIELKCFEDNNDKQEQSLYDDESDSPGIQAFCYFLSIINSEFVHSCHGYCHETFLEENERDDIFNSEEADDSPTHFCNDFREFKDAVGDIIYLGITYVSARHAEVICAFIIECYEAIGFTDKGDDQYFLGSWFDEEYDELLLTLPQSLICGLGKHAHKDRWRLKKLLRDKYSMDDIDHMKEIDDEIQRVTVSFMNCIRALVTISEHTLRRIPACEVTTMIGAEIVRGLIFSFTDYLNPMEADTSDSLRDWILKERQFSLGMISPLRYADIISNFSNVAEIKWEELKNTYFSSNRIRMDSLKSDPVIKLLLSEPFKEVQHVIRWLYFRQLVNFHNACGYGDYIALCRLLPSPHEPMLFEHEANYEEDDIDVFIDEGGLQLTDSRLEARYDLTLLMLNREWHKPWSPHSHASFPKSFQLALKTLALCAFKLHLPFDLVLLINQFIPRSWWPVEEENCECWSYDCQLNSLIQMLIESNKGSKPVQKSCYSKRPAKPVSKDYPIATTKTQTFICKDCCHAFCCSKKHLRALKQQGHKRSCGAPPLRAYCEEDEVLCTSVINHLSRVDANVHNSIDYKANIIDKNLACHVENDDEENDNDDDWVSISSNDDEDIITNKESFITLTSHSFFESKYYRMRRVDEHAFAAFYDENE